MDIDLNEENYNYNDLLNLFGLSHQFNEADLKQAKKKVLKLHPDKCSLPIEYYLFFRKMYYKIEEIYKYTYHSTNKNDYTKSIDINTHFKDYLEHHNIDPKKNFQTFSKEFNKMFEQVFIKENNDGYGQWLQSDEDIYDNNNLEDSREKMLKKQIIKKMKYKKLV